MNLSDMTIGRRVRLPATIRPFPLGEFREGTTGTVSMVNLNAPATDPVVSVLLDEPSGLLKEWDNELWVYREEDNVSDVTPAAFDAIGEDG